MVVDKTGTITKGKPTLTDIKNLRAVTEENLVQILATLENKSEHPIARAIMAYAEEKNIQLAEVANFEAIEGKGLKGIINGQQYLAGNIKLITEAGFQFDIGPLELLTSQGKTPVVVADSQGVLGYVAVADEVKPEAKTAIANLHHL